MGQIQTPPAKLDLILTATDRLIAANADGGLNPAAAHVVLLGENAGHNLGDIDYIYVMGAAALAGGLVDAAKEGSVIIGGKNATALKNASGFVFNNGPNVIVGYNNVPLNVERLGSVIMIGNDILSLQSTNPAFQNRSIDSSVLIGTEILKNNIAHDGDYGVNTRLSVVIGYQACRLTPNIIGDNSGGCQFSANVVLGAQTLLQAATGPTGTGAVIDNNVIIGFQALTRAAASGGAVNANVYIGVGIAPNMRTSDGTVAISPGLETPQQGFNFNTLIGSNIHAQGQENLCKANVVIGRDGNIAGLTSGNTLLGTGANANGDLPNNTGDHCLIETCDLSSFVRRTNFYSKYTLTAVTVTGGGVVLGNSDGTNRDLPGLNVLKLIQGSYNGTPPVGGGLFYVSAIGELHYIGPGGTDTVLAPS